MTLFICKDMHCCRGALFLLLSSKMTQLNDKFSQPLYNDYANMTCSDDDTNILEMHANNSHNCLDYSLFNDDVPFLQNYGCINTVQLGD